MFGMTMAHQNPYRVRRQDRSCMLDGLRHDWDLAEQSPKLVFANGTDCLSVEWTSKFCSVTVNKRYEKPRALLKKGA